MCNTSMIYTPVWWSLSQVFDAFNPRLTDRNSKVNFRALQAFSNMIPLLGNSLVPVLNSVITALLPNLASRNGTIHSIALTVLDLLSHCVGKPDVCVYATHNTCMTVLPSSLVQMRSICCSQWPTTVSTAMPGCSPS